MMARMSRASEREDRIEAGDEVDAGGDGGAGLQERRGGGGGFGGVGEPARERGEVVAVRAKAAMRKQIPAQVSQIRPRKPSPMPGPPEK